jgi:ribonuclease D
MNAAPGEYRRPPELNLLSNDQRARIKEMQARVKQIAEELEVEPAVIASKRDLTRKVHGMECDWLDGWRGELLHDL